MQSPATGTAQCIGSGSVEGVAYLFHLLQAPKLGSPRGFIATAPLHGSSRVYLLPLLAGGCFTGLPASPVYPRSRLAYKLFGAGLPVHSQSHESHRFFFVIVLLHGSPRVYLLSRLAGVSPCLIALLLGCRLTGRPVSTYYTYWRAGLPV